MKKYVSVAILCYGASAFSYGNNMLTVLAQAHSQEKPLGSGHVANIQVLESSQIIPSPKNDTRIKLPSLTIGVVNNVIGVAFVSCMGMFVGASCTALTAMGDAVMEELERS